MALGSEEDQETSAFFWVTFNGDQIKARLSFAVDGTKGLNGAADSTVGEVQPFFDESEGAGAFLSNDQEDLDEVGWEVGWIEERKQIQSTPQ